MTAGLTAALPLPIQVVIDDVGWWSGTDGHERQEPYRTGIARRHGLADYAAIVELGRRLGIRPQAAMILCEWDRHNRLRHVPSATWMGADWACPPFPSAEADAIARLIETSADHIELALHGLGHEYWTAGQSSRAEWYDRQGRMRDPDDVRAHLDAFFRIYADVGFTQPLESYVPTAFLHRFGDDGNGLAALLKPAGIRYLSTPFSTMFFQRPTEHPDLGVEDGLLTVDRGHDLLRWFALGTEPQGAIAGVVCGMHWPNLLHAVPERNPEIVDRWARLLQAEGDRPGRYLAPTTRAAWTQLACLRSVAVRLEESQVHLDFSRLPPVPSGSLEPTLVVDVAAPAGSRVISRDLEITHAALRPDGATTRIHLRRRPDQQKGTLLCQPRP